MKVYSAICNVIQDLAAVGISKNKKNQQQGYNFRGVDDVMNALAPLLPKHGLVILPRVVSRECVERVNKSGTALFYVTVKVEYDFVAVEDGSKHTVITAGEAMDSGDKATNKAMSAAYKYACFQTFCVPTEAVDPDAETHEVQTTTQPGPDPEVIKTNIRKLLQTHPTAKDNFQELTGVHIQDVAGITDPAVLSGILNDLKRGVA